MGLLAAAGGPAFDAQAADRVVDRMIMTIYIVQVTVN